MVDRDTRVLNRLFQRWIRKLTGYTKNRFIITSAKHSCSFCRQPPLPPLSSHRDIQQSRCRRDYNVRRQSDLVFGKCVMSRIIGHLLEHCFLLNIAQTDFARVPRYGGEKEEGTSNNPNSTKLVLISGLSHCLASYNYKWFNSYYTKRREKKGMLIKWQRRKNQFLLQGINSPFLV